MSWLLKSKRLQSAGHGANASSSTTTTNSNSIYSQSSNNLSSSSISSSGGFGSTLNLSSVSLALNTNGPAAASSAPLFNSPHHHLDAGDDMVRQFAASQLDTQKTAFMRWVNDQLAATPNHVPMTSIDRDLKDGKRLIALLEVVSKEPLKPERGNMRIHQMANVSKALAFLEKRTDEPLGSIGNEDIVDGNLKLTLGLVWIIIYRFQIQHIANTMADVYPALATEDMLESDDGTKGKKRGSSQQVDAKQALLRWVRYQLEDYSDVLPPIQDFHRSWRTGLAFAALIHRHDPDFLPEFYNTILPLPFETSEEWRRILTKAFEVAFEKMSVPRLLDPEDLVDVETPDERSIMTYVTEYYIVMTKQQMEQDPSLAAELRARRLQAKDERMALAGEDQQARRLRLKQEEERRKREEEEELERIRLKRMEIEGWSIRAAERAKEEEEALRKRREEEEERRLQRKLRREQRERERALLLQQGSGGQTNMHAPESSGMGSVFSDSDHDFSDSDTEPIDLKEQERRQQELEEKLAEYHQGIAELSEWIREQDKAFPPPPDTTSLLDRARDLEPLTNVIKIVEEEQAVKEHGMSHLHDVREELLEYETPDLAPEQVSDMDKRWWELETIWTAFSNKVVEAKDAAEEVKWIIDCSQEIDRVNGEISKFEAQLEAFAEKRSQETLQDRSQKAVLEQQDVSLSSISFLLKTYVDFLTSLMDPKVHHYTAPEHLTALNNELTTVRLPRLGVVIEKAQQNLSNDRLLRSFLDAFVLSEAWIGESVEWLANIKVPVFVTDDLWNGAGTVKEYVARDVSQDLDLDYYQGEIDELKGELNDEQSEVTTFRSSGFAKLDEQAKAVMKGVVDTQDATAEGTTTTVQDLMQGVMSNLQKVEKLLPKEAEHCAYAARVLDYLWEVHAILMDLEQSATAISKWEMRQPDAEVEALVFQVESLFDTLDSSITDEHLQPTVREAVQSRHSGLAAVVRNLRVCFREKQEAIKGDRQMKEFLELTVTCQATLRDFRTKLHDAAPMTGFGTGDYKPFDDFAALVVAVGESMDKFECVVYTGYLEMGAQVKVMAATSGARQDPTIVHNKLQSVSTLLNDIKALRADRERDVTTVTNCRKLVASLSTLDMDLQALESDLTQLEHLEPHQQDDLAELGNRSNRLQSQFVILEQDSAFRNLTQDPSCTRLLQDISERKSSIQKTQERLQARLEVKQQWNLAWEAFRERSKTLQEYLDDVEKSAVDRGLVSLDCLSADEATWRRSEDVVCEVEIANGEMLETLKDFKVSRLAELSTLAESLKKVAELAGGLHRMDTVRAEQFHDSEGLQRDLQEHLQRLHVMNSQERHQLDTLRKRLLWAQHLNDSKKDVDISTNACRDAVSEYIAILKSSEQSGETSDLDHAAALQLKEQVDHLVTLAFKNKQARFDQALDTHKSLKDLAAAFVPKISLPDHLENELAVFKNQYDLLDLQLEYAGGLAVHARQVTSYLDKNDSFDNKLGALAVQLKANSEASSDTIERVSAARREFENLSQELQQIVSGGPQASDKVSSSLLRSQDEYQLGLDALLRHRLSHTAELKEALEPLLEVYKDLLRYQDSLRDFTKELMAHGQWLEPSNEKVRIASDRIQALYAPWPADGSPCDASHVKDTVISERHSHELTNLRFELSNESAHLDSKEQEFQAIKQQITDALESATTHSKHLQLKLEGSLESIEGRIQELKTDMRHKSYELECLEIRAAWEQQMDHAREWCCEFDATVADFTKNQAQWRAVDGADSNVQLEQQLRALDVSLSEYESQLRVFEDQTMPKVDQAWTDFCGALVLIDKAIPDEFQERHAGLAKECQVLLSKIAHSAEVVKQRKAMEGMDTHMRELDGLRVDLAVIADSDAEDAQLKGGLSLGELESRIRALVRDLEADIRALNFPVDNSSDEAKARSEESNNLVRGHVQICLEKLEATKQTLNEVLHTREVSKRRQELEAVQRNQGETIRDKTDKLERVSGLVNWADETTESVSILMTGAESDEQSVLAASRKLPTVAEMSSHPKDAIESLSVKLEALRQEIEEMVEYKKEVQTEVLGGNLDDEVAGLHISAASEAKSLTKDSSSGESSLHDLEHSINQNHNKIIQLESEITSKLSEFDIKAAAMLASLDLQSQTLVDALKERLRIDEEILQERLRVEREQELERIRIEEEKEQERLRVEREQELERIRIEEEEQERLRIERELELERIRLEEEREQERLRIEREQELERIRIEEEREQERLRIEREQELERLRLQRELEIRAFEDSKTKFLTWSEKQLQDLGYLWETRGYFAKNEELLALSDDTSVSVEFMIASLEADTMRLSEDLAKHETTYLELKSTVDTLYGAEEHETERQRHTKALGAAWSLVKEESAGYTEILNQIKRWSDLRGELIRFEKDGLDCLEKRVEALRWMHWDAFQPEEEALLKLIEDVERQARDLKERADEVSAIEISLAVQANHQAILDGNRIYFDERFGLIPGRIDAAKAHMEVIHETSKEIALHAKFHADLVRVETAIAQQIEAVKARLGSLERSSCFALNSKALETVVVAANEICMDGKYQFSVLQEVEYSGLEQTAFDLDMLAAEESSDILSIRTGVQESMQRIRQALKQLEGYIEEDCFETLLAAKFYTHCKATEDIRQWVTACRDSMAQLDSSSDKNLDEKAKRQQTKEWKTRHLESLEKKLNGFGATVQNYDELSSDFMLLHHPQSSMLDLTEQQQPSSPQEEGAAPLSMRVILRQTIQERTKRTREDWELLKQEFLAKTVALDEMNSEEGNGSDASDVNGSGHLRRGSMENKTVVKTKTLSRFGTEILEDISRVSREVQEMFDHVSSNHSTLSLAVESDGALIKSKNGQARLEMIEGYIRDVLQAKVEKFDSMLSAANEQSEQDQQSRPDNVSEQDVSTRQHMRHHEKMVGVAMQRGLIAESMNRLVESCHHQRKEVEETVRVQNAMDLIHEASLLCDSMSKALTKADSLLTPPEVPTGLSLYNLPSVASSSSSVASLKTRSPIASPSMSPATTISRATAISRERRASRASMRRSFSLSSLSEEDVQQWESNYHSLMEELDGYTHDIERRLDTVSSMADRLNDWRLDENYGVATEHWQKLKKSALAKKQDLDRVWARRAGTGAGTGEMNQGSSVHPLEGQPLLATRPSVMQPTSSSSSRFKTILGSPVEPSPPTQQRQPMRKKGYSTGNIMARGMFVPPSPTPTPSAGTAGRSTTTTRSTVGGRMRSGTTPGRATASQTDVSNMKKYVGLGGSPSLTSLHAMSPTFSQEAKRRPPVIRKNDSTSSISSMAHGHQDLATSPPSKQPRTVYKPDMSNALDVEVARVVNASGFTMKVQKLKEGQSPYLSANPSMTGSNAGLVSRSRSDSTSSLVLSGLSDNGGYEGGMDSTNSSPRAIKTIRGQTRLNVQSKNDSSKDNLSGEVGRYVFGDIEPKVCYCRILRSRKVMVRVGGGWSELSKFMEDHASLEQRKAKAKLLSTSNSSVSVASHFGGSTSVLSGTESRQRQHHLGLGSSGLDGSSDSLSDSLSGNSGEAGEAGESQSKSDTPRMRKKKELIYHVRPSDDLSLKTIKFIKSGAGEGLVAI